MACHRRPVTRGIEGTAKEVERGVRSRPRSGTGIGRGKRRATSEHDKQNITSTQMEVVRVTVPSVL